MASLKSMAQDVLDRSGLSLGDHSKSKFKLLHYATFLSTICRYNVVVEEIAG
jgi:hypothetical protein